MKSQVALCVLLLASSTIFAQKVKTGFKKGTNFAQYKTYSVAPGEMPAQKPILREIIKNTIQQEFAKRGLTQVESGGDLILVHDGSIDYQGNVALTTLYIPLPGYNDIFWDPTMWVGGNVGWAVSGTYFQQGTLALEFVDPKAKAVVWIGTVRQSINFELDSKEKTMKLLDKAIVKLIDEYPPKG
ncbi:hypothetical protein Acid345_1107 [Candidatus Koribacter versatilis Ellin345]|uniref:DUF4136 domain-containing protein n=1 Tax=Koribacter versatilis (strain Ellin345) TaxID=204669 RepID=Q1ISP0_KORVE|nr:DUF4136 domain-containing protein [Candidatus Koribacter versatilis]ABF40110.1 hypothetical protein Acid345_1107 [Candidatus Koribacter versatilis Ellin345]